ncbi:ABC transporter substrate-binding protein [Nocardioides plantarum]|uniref:ABC transporter substrate-binding protein n=1 Tax=Nocardioides plantarum TaxID=29299 RepID=A0ABV5KEJ2_9ACTN|nr:ABC transporter substrate-binding protein [Nocardioides plantarum]
MRLKAPLIAITAVSMAALAACGGSGDDKNDNPGNGESSQNDNLANTGDGTDPEAKGPVTIDGATEGGIVNVPTNVGFTTTIDPSEAYYIDTSSILRGLITRSLTQYKYDAESKQMILVPDLATDLGTPNDDFTEWKFTIRDGVKWEDGTPVTADEVLFGVKRSMDRDAFPTGATYSNDYFLGGDKYKGPYTDPKGEFDGVTVDGSTLTFKMSKPFPDMPYWGAFPAMGAVKEGADSEPAKYATRPLSNGPYKIKSYTVAKSLVLERNDQWDATTDPARTQYPDGYNFSSQVESAKVDQILLGDSGDGQTTLTYDNLLSSDYNKMSQDDPDRIVAGGQPCTNYTAPDNRKITDKLIRQAYAWAYPYKDVILASGDIPGVTAIPATNLMPPGLPGRTEYNVLDHGDFATDAAKSKALLKEAGAEGYELKFLFTSDDPIGVKVKDAVVKGLEAGGFKATPVSTTLADNAADRANPDKDINIRSGGWCSDWPSGASWIPPLLGSTDVENSKSLQANYAAFSEPDVDAKIADIQTQPIEDQPGLWNDLDKEIAEKYFPIITRWYGGVVMAHGSKIQGMENDSVFGMPTWKDIHVG